MITHNEFQSKKKNKNKKDNTFFIVTEWNISVPN